MLEQLAALLVSMVLWGAGAVTYVAACKSRVRALPPEWRHDPALRTGYGGVEAARAIDGLRSFAERRTLAGLGALIGVFCALWLPNSAFGIEVLVTAALAVLWTAAEKAANDDAALKLKQSGAPVLPAPSRLRAASPVWVARYATVAGYLGTASFTGGLIAVALR